jgi:hypothetical protein
MMLFMPKGLVGVWDWAVGRWQPGAAKGRG